MHKYKIMSRIKYSLVTNEKFDFIRVLLLFSLYIWIFKRSLNSLLHKKWYKHSFCIIIIIAIFFFIFLNKYTRIRNIFMQDFERSKNYNFIKKVFFFFLNSLHTVVIVQCRHIHRLKTNDLRPVFKTNIAKFNEKNRNSKNSNENFRVISLQICPIIFLIRLF